MYSRKVLNTSREKSVLLDALVRPAKAAANPHRLELLDLLFHAPRTVEALAAASGMTTANTSQHLQVLRAAGLVTSTKDGLYVTYRLASEVVVELVRAIRAVAEAHVAELAEAKRAYLAGSDDVAAVSGRDLLARVEAGDVVLLDVRPAQEFAHAHLPHAVNVPIEELARRLGELPRSTAIVAYCRGPYCAYAGEAVRLLRRRGFRASRIEEGVGEWRALALPVVSGASSAVRS